MMFFVKISNISKVKYLKYWDFWEFIKKLMYIMYIICVKFKFFMWLYIMIQYKALKTYDET